MYSVSMTLLLIGAGLAVLSTLIVQAIQQNNVLLAGMISALTTYLSVYAIIDIIGGSDSALYAIGVGLGTASTVYWSKKKTPKQGVFDAG